MTERQQWLSRRYIIYLVLSRMWFVGAVWLYFYRIFITDQQIGILDGMAFAIGLLAEVPSGALADRFGRDNAVRLGQILSGGGLLIQSVGNSFTQFFIGQAIMMIGVSFVSGADDALFFENLKFKRSSIEWRKLVTRGSQFALVGTFIVTILGGFLHTINPRIPWILNGIAFICAAIAIWPIRDTRAKSNRQRFVTELKSNILSIKAGFLQFGLPKLRLYVPLILTIQGLFYTTGYGLLRLVLLDRFHYSPSLGSVVIASSSIITVALLSYMHKNAHQFKEKHVLSVIGLVAASSLLLSLANIGLWGYFVILVLYAGEHTLHPFMSEVLNHHAAEDQRATVLSVASFIKTLPYVVLAPIIGLLNVRGKLNIFLVIWPLLIAIALVYYLSVKKRDEKIAFPA